MSSSTLLIEIDEGFKGTLTDPTLVVNHTSYSLPLPKKSLQRKDKVEVKLPVSLKPSDDVTLEFTVDGKRSAMSTVLLTK